MPSRRIQDLALRIAMQVQRATAKGVQAAAIFLAARLKECVSVPAPRKRVTGRLGNMSYVATTRAIKGHPPRKLSGKLRQSITYTIVNPTPMVVGGRKVTGGTARVGLKARSAKGFNYPRHLEKRTSHKFMIVTVQRYRRDLATIVGRPIRARII